MKKHISFILISLFILINPTLYAQLKVSAELRNRGEANHGYMYLPDEYSQTAFFMSQRTRINADFRKHIFHTYISIQDVRLWGQEDIASKTGIQASSMGIDVSQAWLDWNFAKNWGLKIGRQIWDYDDGRMLSSRNWNQYALSWDALLLHIDKDDFHFHFGSSINNTFVSFDPSKFVMEDNPYEEPLYYRIRYFNFIWAKFIASKHFSLSFSEYLASYLGHHTTTTFYNLFTSGVHVDYHSERLKIMANAFYQYGKKNVGENGNAYMATISGSYKTRKLILGLGFDYLSGHASNINKSHAFDLMYGARHRYYGWMNYYLITKNTRKGGLLDLYPSIKWVLNQKHSLDMTYHKNWLAQYIYNDILGVVDYSYLNKNLGGELDFRYTYKYDNSFQVQLFSGYYFATGTTEFVKGVRRGHSTSPYWVSIMLTYKPQLFKN